MVAPRPPSHVEGAAVAAASGGVSIGSEESPSVSASPRTLWNTDRKKIGAKLDFRLCGTEVGTQRRLIRLAPLSTKGRNMLLVCIIWDARIHSGWPPRHEDAIMEEIENHGITCKGSAYPPRALARKGRPRPPWSPPLPPRSPGGKVGIPSSTE